MLTADKTIKTAVEAMKIGAADYLTKPFDVEELRMIVAKVLATQALEHEVRALRAQVLKSYSFHNLVGKSPAMQEVYSKIEQAADTRTTVLITGESGTGKELVARALHYNSSRREQPFIAINCASIPETLIESELFGHEKGAFTGALARRLGRVELAHGGTLFLDEIGDLELALQAKLLRALERGEVQPLGSEKPRQVDVRIVTATNRNLRARMEAGQFREDLYWRVNVITLELPPLRERRGDLPLLVRHFLERFAEELGKERPHLDPDVERALLAYSYPGNIRELENILRRAVILAQGSRVSVGDLPPRVVQIEGRRDPMPATNTELKAAKARAAAAASRDVERLFLTELLAASGGNVTEAARRVGMNRSWLHQLLVRHRLSPRAFHQPDPPR